MKNIRAVAARLVLTLALLCGSVGYALADAYRSTDAEGTVVTLLATACVSEKAAAEPPRLNGYLAQASLPPVPAADLHAATVTWRGKTYGACWVAINADVVAVLDDAGLENSVFPVPTRALQRVTGI